MNDIKYSYAVNKHNILVNVNEAKKEDKPFYLYGSGIKVIPRQGEINTWHFATYSGQHGGGESPEHYNAKMKIKTDGYFIFDDVKIISDKIEVEVYHKVSDYKKKQPDVTFYDDKGDLMCAIEIYVTNKKTEEDIEYLKKLNIPIYEYDYHKNETRLLCWSALTERYIERYKVLCERETERIEYSIKVLKSRRDLDREYNKDKGEVENLMDRIETISLKITDVEYRIRNYDNEERSAESFNEERERLENQIRKTRGFIAWQDNRSKQASTICKRGF